jgi:hypothetical protein
VGRRLCTQIRNAQKEKRTQDGTNGNTMYTILSQKYIMHKLKKKLRLLWERCKVSAGLKIWILEVQDQYANAGSCISIFCHAAL